LFFAVEVGSGLTPLAFKRLHCVSTVRLPCCPRKRTTAAILCMHCSIPQLVWQAHGQHFPCLADCDCSFNCCAASVRDCCAFSSACRTCHHDWCFCSCQLRSASKWLPCLLIRCWTKFKPTPFLLGPAAPARRLPAVLLLPLA